MPEGATGDLTVIQPVDGRSTSVFTSEGWYFTFYFHSAFEELNDLFIFVVAIKSPVGVLAEVPYDLDSGA